MQLESWNATVVMEEVKDEVDECEVPLERLVLSWILCCFWKYMSYLV